MQAAQCSKFLKNWHLTYIFVKIMLITTTLMVKINFFQEIVMSFLFRCTIISILRAHFLFMHRYNITWFEKQLQIVTSSSSSSSVFFGATFTKQIASGAIIMVIRNFCSSAARSTQASRTIGNASFWGFPPAHCCIGFPK